MSESFLYAGQAVTDPLLYRDCGLDGIYLLNGYAVLEHDGERHVSVTDVEGLHKAIGRHLVSYRKTLAPKEIRFLRNVMDITQAELAGKIGKNSQSVARWEKGESPIPATAEKLLRVIFLASLSNPNDLAALKDLVNEKMANLDSVDEVRPPPARFERSEHWMDTAA